MSQENIGTISIEISSLEALGVGSTITIAGRCYDARTQQELIVSSANLTVYMAVKERVIDRLTGDVVTLPKTDNWSYLYPNEYEIKDDVQSADNVTSTVPWTFRFQPTRERMPLFKEVGIYELWFRFVTENSNKDDIRLTFVVKVGQPVAPRRVDSV